MSPRATVGSKFYSFADSTESTFFSPCSLLYGSIVAAGFDFTSFLMLFARWFIVTVILSRWAPRVAEIAGDTDVVTPEVVRGFFVRFATRVGCNVVLNSFYTIIGGYISGGSSCCYSLYFNYQVLD